MSKKSLGIILGFAAIAVIFVAVFYGKGGTFKGEFGEFPEPAPTSETEPVPPPQTPCGGPEQPPCPTEAVPPPTSGTEYPTPGSTPACGAPGLPPCLPGTLEACGREGLIQCPADAFCQPGTQLGEGPGPITCEPIFYPPTTCSLTNCDLFGILSSKIDFIATSHEATHNKLSDKLDTLYSLIHKIENTTDVLATIHVDTIRKDIAAMNNRVVDLINTRANSQQLSLNQLQGRLCNLAIELSKTAVHPQINKNRVCATPPSIPPIPTP